MSAADSSAHSGELRPREVPSPFATGLKKRLYRIMRQGWGLV